MEASPRTCGTCDCEMRRIKLNDATGAILNQHGTAHVEPTYSAIDANASFWNGVVPIEGVIQAYMCDICRQILLFGEPKRERR